ncbi:MAG: putative Ig domain-containing protein [Bacteroidales bacterium]|jgi:hypothetical protein|nr:putative Ig domain-containing protein [Bacteroidales bacterium]
MKKCTKNKKMRRFSILNFKSSICFLVFSMLSFCSMAQNVYVGGELLGNAAVWTNGVPTILSNGCGGCIYSVIVDNGNVYATGFVREVPVGPSILKVWKDGVELYVVDTEGATQTDSYSVSVSGNGDVYTVGRIRLDGVYIGKVWKNGIVEPGYENSSVMSSVFISGDDVYVAGTTTDSKATVWKNGEVHLTFNADTPGYAKSVVVVDDIIYTACFKRIDEYTCMPQVYKDNTLLYALESTGSLSAMYSMGLYVSDDDVYVAGHERPYIGGFGSVPKLWKNDLAFDLPTTIPDPTFAAHSVFKFNDDVYVSGAPGGLWINGIITPLPENGFCITHSVFVTPSDMPPTIITESLPDGTAGAPYSATLEAESDMPVTWSIENGSLPEGLSLDAATGEISGTSTETELSEFIIKATNASGSDIKVLTIVIHLAPTITITSLPDGTTGALYFATLEADSQTPITWSIENGNLPTGLSIDATTGVIDGLPVEVGIFDFTIQAINTAGGSASKELSIIIEFRLGIGELRVTSDELQIFPNPTDGVLTIEMGDTGFKICDITIYDVYGRKCLVINSPPSMEGWQPKADGVVLDISDLPAGVYFVKINTEAGEVMKKVVKK